MILFIISSLVLFYTLRFLYGVLYARKYLPPGPLGLPMVGNYLQLGRLPHLKLTAWSRKYGPVFSIRLGIRLCVVVNDAQAVKEIFVRRGLNYSSRNQSHLINDVCFRTGKGVSVLTYGEQWRKMRRVMHRALNLNVIDKYLPVLNLEMKNLLIDLLSTSNENPVHGFFPETMMKKYSFDSIIALLIGRSLLSTESYIMEEFIQAADELHKINNVGANFLAYFPFFNKLYNHPTFEKGYKNREKRERIIRRIQELARSKERVKGYKYQETLLEVVEEHAESDGLDNLDVVYICDSLLRGGFDSTACFLTWATLIMARIPRVQEKLHSEIEQVVGPNRFPDYQKDVENLPYLNAFLKELFRFRTPSFLGIPHASMKDDIYRDYLIPNDTLIILNSHAIHFDPARYTSPEKFEPERFLEKDSHGRSKDVEDWNHYAFGAGRRICAGSHFADREVWVAVAGIVWAFQVIENQTLPMDQQLREEDMTRGLANYPLEYKINFISRRPNLSHMLL